MSMHGSEEDESESLSGAWEKWSTPKKFSQKSRKKHSQAKYSLKHER